MDLRNKSNDELFELYQAEIILKNRNTDARKEYTRILFHLKEYLGEFPPSAALAKNYLSQFSTIKSATLYKYAAVIKGFMKWYGEPIDEIKIRVPSPLPDYISDEDIDKLKEAIKSVKSHKQNILRNILLVDFAVQTGLRCAELADFKIDNIDFDRELIIVRAGKEQRDRVVPLLPAMLKRLREFISGKGKEESLFGLDGSTISGLIHKYAVKAGVNVHIHSLRYKFGTDLNERVVDIRTIQTLMGHQDIGTTERYIAINKTSLRNAIDRLGKPPESVAKPDVNGPGIQGTNQESQGGRASSDNIPDKGRQDSNAGAWLQQDRHQQNMLKIVERWRQELPVSCADLAIFDLYSQETLTDSKTGLHSFSKSRPGEFQAVSVAWQVRDGESIDLCHSLELETDSETVILRDYLNDHIRSGPYSWVLNAPDTGMVKWKQLGGQELKERTLLLNRIEAQVKRITRYKSIVDDIFKVDRSGPTKWFVESICGAIVDNIYNNLPYYPVEALEVSAVDGRSVKLFKAPYGARCVGYATTRAGALRFQEWHWQVLNGSSSDGVARIKEYKADREKLTREMDEILAKLVVDGKVAGSCSGCHTQ